MSNMRTATNEVKRLRKLLTKRRKARKLTLRELGKLSGVSFSTINKFENGKEIQLTNYCALLVTLFGERL